MQAETTQTRDTRPTTLRFLHAADLHIDSPLRGLERYEGAPVQRLRTATRVAAARLVDLAIDEAVDFVLLAGDIYDRDWQDFHTGLYFREQMVRLDKAGIPVFIVQGNHDAQGVISRQLPLPQNVKVFPSRSAETVRIDALAVAIHGRSFPNRAVDEDLVPGYPEPVTGYFNIGVLHTSLAGRPEHDTYAPTETATLIAKGYDYWALGHIHAREVVREQHPRIVFPGNPQGRHAKETGAKGCELVTVQPGGGVEASFVPLDVVRWEHLSLNLDTAAVPGELASVFRQAIVPVLAQIDDELLALRVTLTGVSPLYELEASQPGTLDAAVRAAAQDITDAEIWIEQVRSTLVAPIDRNAAAHRQDAIGELVNLVNDIANDEAALRTLAHTQLGALLGRLPDEVRTMDVPALEQTADLRALLLDAEATVLARLADSGQAP